MSKAVPCLALIAGLLILMTGCGGGGEAGPGPLQVMPMPDTQEEALRQEYAAHPEFRNQYALAQIKAHYAYARGATGEGVTLGIVDSGVDPSHPKFEDKLETSHVEGYDPDFSVCENRASDETCLSTLGHGTFVAGVMSANRYTGPNGSTTSESAMHGVAFGARIISVGFPSIDEIIGDILTENPTPEQIRDLPETIRGIESTLEKQFATAFNRLNSRVTAVNASFGLPGNIEGFDAEALRDRFPNVIEAVAQKDTPASQRTIYVWAAGNARGEIKPDGSLESGSSVEIVAGLPARIPELRGHSLAVVATDPQGRIAEFSNRCGIAKAFCLAAPGMDIAGPVPSFYCPAGTKECYLRFQEGGTSSAAPFVTGGIGLLAQHYRNQLGHEEIVQRMLATADKTGVYADSDMYGQGFLDLDAATRPVGEMRMLTGYSLSGPSALSSNSAFHLGEAFGDSLAQGLASEEVASFDELDAPFFRPLGDHLRPHVTPTLEERLRMLGNDSGGTAWGVADNTKFQLRLDVVSTSTGIDDIHSSRLRAENRTSSTSSNALLPGSLGSLVLAHSLGNGQLQLGVRSHPGWQFGLYADNGAVDRSSQLIESGAFTDDSAFANPFLSFARNGTSIGYATGTGAGALRIAAFHGTAQYGELRDTKAGRATGFLMEYQFDSPDGVGLAMQAGGLSEAQGLIGSRPSGAFGEIGADTGIMGLSAHHNLNDAWSVLASAHAGMSRTRVREHGMVRDPSTLWASSFALGLIGKGFDRAGGRLSFRLSQPLRIEAGQVKLHWVSGRTPDGQVKTKQATVYLEPSGRQLDLEVMYSRPWAGGQVHLAGIASHDAGHVRGKYEAALLGRYHRTF